MQYAPEDRFVEVNGLRLHYLDWGGTSDKPLILLHGISANCHSWDSFAQQCCQEFRVLALDQRGHGDSDHARDGYPVTAFASDLYGFVRALEIDRFDLIGHSLGARNAMPFAGEHSDLLSHLALVDFGPEIVRQGARNVMARVGQRPLAFRSAEEAVAYFRELNPTRSRDFLEHAVTHGLRLNWAGKLVWKHDPELLWITGSAGLKEVPYLWEQCAQISCPTLILRGEASDILAAETLAKMVSVIPGARAVEVPSAGHSIHLDQPQEFERVVLDFLRS